MAAFFGKLRQRNLATSIDWIGVLFILILLLLKFKRQAEDDIFKIYTSFISNNTLFLDSASLYNNFFFDQKNLNISM